MTRMDELPATAHSMDGMYAVPPVRQSPPKAITTYWGDVWLGGLLSIVVIGPIAWLNLGLTGGNTADDFLLFTILINYPHFMASYRLLYGKDGSSKQHRYAAWILPAGLLLWFFGALAFAEKTSAPGTVLTMITTTYLAWHYTGQSWGMVATFSHLDNVQMTAKERNLLRWSFHILLAWFVAWFYEQQRDIPPWMISTFDITYRLASYAIVASVILGAIAFYSIRTRLGRPVPFRTVVPWVAIYVWYALLARYPAAALFVQLAHALQYLAFPFRVQENRWRRHGASMDRFAMVRRWGGYYVVLVVVGLIAIRGFPQLCADLVVTFGGDQRVITYAALTFFAAVNMHHYITDGVSWKLRDRTVRDQLFAHL